MMNKTYRINNRGYRTELSNSTLEKVYGGNVVDRSMLISKLKKMGMGQYMDCCSGYSDEEILSKFCSKFNIGYHANMFEFDHFTFDGHDFSTPDLKNPDNVKLLTKHIVKNIFA